MFWKDFQEALSNFGINQFPAGAPLARTMRGPYPILGCLVQYRLFLLKQSSLLAVVVVLSLCFLFCSSFTIIVFVYLENTPYFSLFTFEEGALATPDLWADQSSSPRVGKGAA